MKPISTHIQEILEETYTGSEHIGDVYNTETLTRILEAIKSRDSYCLGEEEDIRTFTTYKNQLAVARNAKRSEIQERMKKSL